MLNFFLKWATALEGQSQKTNSENIPNGKKHKLNEEEEDKCEKSDRRNKVLRREVDQLK